MKQFYNSTNVSFYKQKERVKGTNRNRQQMNKQAIANIKIVALELHQSNCIGWS